MGKMNDLWVASDKLVGLDYDEIHARAQDLVPKDMIYFMGYSDDAIVIYGGVHDEVYEGPIYIKDGKIVKSECDDAGNECPYFKRYIESLNPVIFEISGPPWKMEINKDLDFVMIPTYDLGDFYGESYLVMLEDVEKLNE